MAGGIIASFQRYELKYFLTPEQREAIWPVLMEHFRVDSYGKHTISNIYYDTDQYDIIRESIEKPVYKEKLRLRAYGVPNLETGQVFLELKKKYDHVVYKRRIAIPVSEAYVFLSGGPAPPHSDPQITSEIGHFLDMHHPKPKVFLSYDRIAMAGIENSDLRITMDSRLLWRTHEVDLCLGAYGNPLLPEDITLMEIKVPGAMPLWLAHLLSENQIFNTSFSKIGTCYKQFILPQIFKEGTEPAHV
ncbi:MAG: polyphosphate polymerase domain-containing protein [Oscillospiraceae bacterium]|nr:polyphosphate polymerase domain-containing protein [Oscillospiraceae bacterium]